MRGCCNIYEWFMNEKKTAAGAHKKNYEQVAQFDFWNWGLNFHEQGSWTKGILIEQRKLDRPMLFLLATKRAWSAPGAKVKFVYERVMSRLWVIHERLHLEVNQTKKNIYIYIYIHTRQFFLNSTDVLRFVFMWIPLKFMRSLWERPD